MTPSDDLVRLTMTKEEIVRIRNTGRGNDMPKIWNVQLSELCDAYEALRVQLAARAELGSNMREVPPGGPLSVESDVTIVHASMYRAEPQPVAWRPIENAPKDGTKIIVAKFGKNEVGKDLGFWWASGATWREGLYQHAWHDGTEWLVTPTHWQPIAPPACALGGEPKPIGQIMSEDQMGIGWDRRAGNVIWWDKPEGPTMLYAQPVDAYALGFQEAREAAAKVCDAQANLRYMSSGIGHVTDAAIGMASQLAIEIRALEPKA